MGSDANSKRSEIGFDEDGSRPTQESSRALRDVVPQVFCWTKMGTEAGQAVVTILRRKEFERRAGSGLFVWGIGNALGPGLVELVRRSPTPMVVFSEMRAKARTIDVNPGSVHLWLSYIGHDGHVVPLPPHCIVTSRGESGSGLRKARHYGLFCRRRTQIAPVADHTLRFSELRNLVSGRPLGFSQVTALVERTSEDLVAMKGPEYPVTFVAELTWPYFAQLAHPVALPEHRLHDLHEMAAGGIEAADWSAWALRVRLEARELAFENAVGQRIKHAAEQ